MTESIFDIVNEAVKKTKERNEIEFATVSNVIEGKPILMFVGESSPSLKEYKFAKSYIPAIGDRVMLIKGIIVCGISY